MDGPGPRYTSYPTADRFEAFGADRLEDAFAERRRMEEADSFTPLSLYIHIPFCESVCYYCACNKVITKHHERAKPYLDALGVELDLVTDAIGWQRSLAQIHLGGGSPTFLSDTELSELMTAVRGAFFVNPDAEISIEIDPRTVTGSRLEHLRGLGFNRLSFGVQDFDPDVQEAVHRVQSFDSVSDLMRQARALGFKSINADLIYGLPRQTPASFERTIAQISSLRPCMHTPILRSASSRNVASTSRSCRRPSPASRCSPPRWPASRAWATPTSAWTTSRCRTMRSRLPSAKDGCIAISRATARIPTATSWDWASLRSAASAATTTRTRRPCPTTTPLSRRGSCRWSRV
jgi:hypothetical protein